MTDTSPNERQTAAGPDAVRGPAADLTAEHDASRKQVAARLRREHPRWIVIWIPHEHAYRAYPLFRTPAGTAVTATTPDGLVGQMSQIPEPARRLHHRPPAQADTRP